MLAPVLFVLCAADPLEQTFSLQRGVTGGGFTELQVAPPNDKPDWAKFEHWKKDSIFIPTDAATLLWKPFHDVDREFSEYEPRLFDPVMLGKLADALAAHQKEWLALDSLAKAKARWAKFSKPVDDLKTEAEWKRA